MDHVAGSDCPVEHDRRFSGKKAGEIADSRSHGGGQHYADIDARQGLYERLEHNDGGNNVAIGLFSTRLITDDELVGRALCLVEEDLAYTLSFGHGQGSVYG